MTTELDELIAYHREKMYQAQRDGAGPDMEKERQTVRELDKWRTVKPLIDRGVLGVRK